MSSVTKLVYYNIFSSQKKASLSSDRTELFSPQIKPVCIMEKKLFSIFSILYDLYGNNLSSPLYSL